MKKTFLLSLIFLWLALPLHAQNYRKTQKMLAELIEDHSREEGEQALMFEDDLVITGTPSVGDRTLSEEELEHLLILESSMSLMSIMQVIDLRGITRVTTRLVPEVPAYYTIKLELDDSYLGMLLSHEYLSGKTSNENISSIVLGLENDARVAQKVHDQFIKLAKLHGATVVDGGFKSAATSVDRLATLMAKYAIETVDWSIKMGSDLQEIPELGNRIWTAEEKPHLLVLEERADDFHSIQVADLRDVSRISATRDPFSPAHYFVQLELSKKGMSSSQWLGDHGNTQKPDIQDINMILFGVQDNEEMAREVLEVLLKLVKEHGAEPVNAGVKKKL